MQTQSPLVPTNTAPSNSAPDPASSCPYFASTPTPSSAPTPTAATATSAGIPHPEAMAVDAAGASGNIQASPSGSSVAATVASTAMSVSSSVKHSYTFPFASPHESPYTTLDGMVGSSGAQTLYIRAELRRRGDLGINPEGGDSSSSLDDFTSDRHKIWVAVPWSQVAAEMLCQESALQTLLDNLRSPGHSLQRSMVLRNLGILPAPSNGLQSASQSASNPVTPAMSFSSPSLVSATPTATLATDTAEPLRSAGMAAAAAALFGISSSAAPDSGKNDMLYDHSQSSVPLTATANHFGSMTMPTPPPAPDFRVDSPLFNSVPEDLNIWKTHRSSIDSSPFSAVPDTPVTPSFPDASDYYYSSASNSNSPHSIQTHGSANSSLLQHSMQSMHYPYGSSMSSVAGQQYALAKQQQHSAALSGSANPAAIGGVYAPPPQQQQSTSSLPPLRTLTAGQDVIDPVIKAERPTNRDTAEFVWSPMDCTLYGMDSIRANAALTEPDAVKLVFPPGSMIMAKEKDGVVASPAYTLTHPHSNEWLKAQVCHKSCAYRAGTTSLKRPKTVREHFQKCVWLDADHPLKALASLQLAVLERESQGLLPRQRRGRLAIPLTRLQPYHTGSGRLSSSSVSSSSSSTSTTAGPTASGNSGSTAASHSKVSSGTAAASGEVFRNPINPVTGLFRSSIMQPIRRNVSRSSLDSSPETSQLPHTTSGKVALFQTGVAASSAGNNSLYNNKERDNGNRNASSTSSADLGIFSGGPASGSAGAGNTGSYQNSGGAGAPQSGSGISSSYGQQHGAATSFPYPGAAVSSLHTFTGQMHPASAQSSPSSSSLSGVSSYDASPRLQ